MIMGSKDQDYRKPAKVYGVSVRSESQAKRIAIQMKPLMEAWKEYTSQDHKPAIEYKPSHKTVYQLPNKWDEAA
jgi:hypothetical protein